MDKRDQVLNIRVSQGFLDALDRHIDNINSEDTLNRTLDRSTFVRALINIAIEEQNNE